MGFEWSSQADQPSEEEQKAIENQAPFFEFALMGPEQKKTEIIRRWQIERSRNTKPLPGIRDVFGLGGKEFDAGYAIGQAIGGFVAKVGSEALGALVKQAAAEGARNEANIIRSSREQQQKLEGHQAGLKKLLLSRRADSMLLNESRAGTQEVLEEQEVSPQASYGNENEPTREETEDLEPYFETDVTTIPEIRLSEEHQKSCQDVSRGFINRAENEHQTWVLDNPELAEENKTFFNNVGELTQRGDIDSALRVLDANLGAGETNVWNRDTRRLAGELGRVKREAIGELPADFGDIEYALSKNAAELTELQTSEDINDGAELLMMLDRINEPGEPGNGAVREVLDYSERILSFRTQMLNKKLAQMAKGGEQEHIAMESEFGAQFWRGQVEEAQRMRDAAVLELERRKIEENATTESFDEVPPMIVGPEASLDDEAEIARIRDEIFARFEKSESAQSNGFSTTEQTPDNPHFRQNAEGQKYSFPRESRSAMRYAIENIAPIARLPIEKIREHQQEYSEQLREYSRWFMSSMAKEAKENQKAVRYGGTVAAVLGDGMDPEALLQRLIYVKTGENIDMKDLGGRNFAELAKEVLDLDVNEIPDANIYWNVSQNA